jgi:hypothetical protein
MSSGRYCLIKDLGLVKGGKGMRHHGVIIDFSFGGISKAAWRGVRKLVTVITADGLQSSLKSLKRS